MYNNISRYSEEDIEQILSQKLGERYVEYRKMWNSVTPTNIPSFPIHIDFEMNDLCNQSCIMCPRNTDMHPDINYAVNTKSVQDFETFKKIIDEGVPKGLKSINMGAFAESLIHKDVFKMIKYAHDQGIVDSRIISNGLLLNKHVDDIFDSGLVNLFISVDAFTEEKYEEIRGHGFKKVKDNLLNFLEEKKKRNSILPIVRVSFVDMKTNHQEKEDFIQYWRDKVSFIDIQIYDNYNVDITKPFDMEQKKKWECRSPFSRISVMSDGKILPCCNFFGKNVPVGNIKESSIEDIWKSDAIENIRSGVVNDTLRNCSICQRIG